MLHHCPHAAGTTLDHSLVLLFYVSEFDFETTGLKSYPISRGISKGPVLRNVTLTWGPTETRPMESRARIDRKRKRERTKVELEMVMDLYTRLDARAAPWTRCFLIR